MPTPVMRKPEILREQLLQRVRGLDPTELSIFIDRGKVRARATGSLSFEYAYTLNLVLMNFSGQFAEVAVPLLAFIAEQQPELLSKEPPEPFTFDCEILDAENSDISIELDLTERVLVTPHDGGGYEVRSLPEKSPLEPFGGFDGHGVMPLREIVASAARS